MCEFLAIIGGDNKTHGGRISVESEVGTGTTFFFYAASCMSLRARAY
jgi:light-regulated signal transduction histidine kinase (bacteriophytochrome)